MFQKLFVNLYCQSSLGPQRRRCYSKGTVQMISVRFMLYNSACASHLGCWKRTCTECPALQTYICKNSFVSLEERMSMTGFGIAGSVLVFWPPVVQYMGYDCCGESLIFKVPVLQLLIILKSHRMQFVLCALQYQIELCNCGKLTVPELFHPSKELNGWGSAGKS